LTVSDHLRDKGYTDRAEPITGIPVTIALARELLRQPAMPRPSRARHYTNDADASRAIYLLDAITGNVDNPGNIYSKIGACWAASAARRGQDLPQKPPLHVAMGYPLAPDLPTGLLPAAVLEEKPYPIKAIFVQATNPVMSDPNTKRVQEMYRHLDFGVAIDVYLSETALECDLVLPETSFYERDEIRQGLAGRRRLPAGCPPVGESSRCTRSPKASPRLASSTSTMGLGRLGPPAVRGLPMSSEEFMRKASVWRGDYATGCGRRLHQARSKFTPKPADNGYDLTGLHRPHGSSR
jgi:anaerobic selenocysteine-containing dehydrogenase